MVTPNVLRVIRVLRIGRLLRYFKAAKGIRRQLVALVISLPALFNIGTLLFLTLFIYAIIGMTSFGHVKKMGAIDNVVNFETFGQSMLVLFRLSTSAGWNEVLESLMLQPPNCDPKFKGLPNGNCGQPFLAVLYMVSFILVTFMVIVNMYIAVILENFNQATEDEEIGVTDDDIQMFYTHWQRYDPNATQYIEFKQLSGFLDELDSPLRIPRPNESICSKLNIPIRYRDKIHCADVLLASLKHTVVGHIDETDEETLRFISNTIENKLQTAFPVRAKDPSLSSTAQKMLEMRAAITIQTVYKRWKNRSKIALQRNISLEMKERMSGEATEEGQIDIYESKELQEPHESQNSIQHHVEISLRSASQPSAQVSNGSMKSGSATIHSSRNSSPKSNCTSPKTLSSSQTSHLKIQVESKYCNSSISE